MDIRVQGKTLKNLINLFDRSKTTEPTVKITIKKPLCPNKEPEKMSLERADPESTGVESSHIAGFIQEICEKKELDMHGIMIVRDGKIICDAEFGAYKSEFWHAGYSLSKSVAAMAIGMLIDEGKLSLDSKAVKILEKRAPALSQLTHKAITVRHLLTMTAGVGFSESGASVEENWVRAFFESFVKSEPGKKFNYNSMNTYILSCIVKEISGQTLREYLKPRLFEPLGITVMHWEQAPDGNEIGGWGIYLRREDVAKLGVLYVNGGEWNHKRIISEKWIKESTSAKVSHPEDSGNYDYGYHIWTGKDMFLFNGMFGQDMIAFPKTKTVIVSNAGIEQLFQQSCYYGIVEKYFGGNYANPFPLKCNKKSKKELDRLLYGLSCKAYELREDDKLWGFRQKKLPRFLLDAEGKKYAIKKRQENLLNIESIADTANLGIMPMIAQMGRNSFARGMKGMGFEKRQGKLCLKIIEGREEYSVLFYPQKMVFSVLNIGGTEYHLATYSETAFDEYNREVLKLKLFFPELASSRLINIYFDKDFIDVKMKEVPGMGLVNIAITAIESAVKGKKFISDIVTKIDPHMMYFKLKNTIEPEFRLYCDGEKQEF